MIIGYFRVSTDKQEIERQRRILKEYGVEEIFEEKKSGKNAERAELKRMLDYARKGDVIFVESISRIARNTRDFYNILDILEEKEVAFKSAKEEIDTKTPRGRFMLNIFASLAELEREMIVERVREGVAIAKEQGKYKGKPKKAIDEEKLKRVCARWRAGEITARQAMKEVGLKSNTFYRRVKEMNI